MSPSSSNFIGGWTAAFATVLFWAMFHVIDLAPTESELTPDFAAGDCDFFSICKWYGFHIFFGTNHEAKILYEHMSII